MHRVQHSYILSESLLTISLKNYLHYRQVEIFKRVNVIQITHLFLCSTISIVNSYIHFDSTR